MPRVSEITEAGGNAELEALFESDRARFGELLGSTKVLAHCPPILKAARQLGAAIEKSGQLPPRMLPLVYLRVALINGCPA